MYCYCCRSGLVLLLLVCCLPQNVCCEHCVLLVQSRGMHKEELEKHAQVMLHTAANMVLPQMKAEAAAGGMQHAHNTTAQHCCAALGQFQRHSFASDQRAGCREQPKCFLPA